MFAELALPLDWTIGPIGPLDWTRPGPMLIGHINGHNTNLRKKNFLIDEKY
jgi:hypothetical protein